MRKTRISGFRFVGYGGVELDVDVVVDMSMGVWVGLKWLWRHRGGMFMRLWNYEGIGNRLVFGVILRSAK